MVFPRIGIVEAVEVSGGSYATVVDNRSSRVLIFGTLFKEERGTTMVPRAPRPSLRFGPHCVVSSHYLLRVRTPLQTRRGMYAIS